MELQSLIESFSQIGKAKVGHGPRHPTSPNESLLEQVTLFFEQYPTLKTDQGFLDFMQMYSGISIGGFEEDETYFLDIYGFAEDISIRIIDVEMAVAEGDKELIHENFFIFCDITMDLIHENGPIIGLRYALDISGKLKPGVYLKLHDSRLHTLDEALNNPFEWYCDNFMYLLKEIVETKGKMGKP